MDVKFERPVIRNGYDMVYNKKGNCLIGITGPVNSGKSHTAVYIGSVFQNNFDLEHSLVYTVRDLIDRSLAFIKYKGKPLNLEMFDGVSNVISWLKENIEYIHISPGKIVIMDETGALGAYVREFFSMDNKTLAKIIQIWRILRMVVIFVVPEDLSLAESTISKFLNIEIKMKGLQKDPDNGEYASCVAWTFGAWNKRTRERYRKRIMGCRYGGEIRVPPLYPELSKKYEDVSRTHKIAALVNMGREYKINEPINVGSTKSIWDDINYVKDNIEKFKGEKGTVTIDLIQSGLNVSNNRARLIASNIKKMLSEGAKK